MRPGVGSDFCNPSLQTLGEEALCGLQLRDADAVRELLTDAQQRTAQLQADLMQARQDTQQASLAYQRERVSSDDASRLPPLMTYVTLSSCQASMHAKVCRKGTW